MGLAREQPRPLWRDLCVLARALSMGTCALASGGNRWVSPSDARSCSTGSHNSIHLLNKFGEKSISGHSITKCLGQEMKI